MLKRIGVLTLTIVAAVTAASARTVSGVVLSDRDSLAVVGASCRLMADNQFIAGVSADASGAFTISSDVKSGLTLEIGMTGYNTTEILIESGAKNIDLGHIFLNEGVALDNVTVSAGSMVDVKGRTIIYPSSADVKASSGTISLFQKLPLAGLEANPVNRTLSVDGGSPVILINGIPSTIDDVNALQPKNIAKIEFSRIAPARYADKGNSGFINITLHKRSDGGDVYIWGRSAVTTTFVDANVQASYHQGASQFTLAYNPSWRNYQSVFDDGTSSYIGDDFRVNLEEHDRNPFNYAYHNMLVKYDYSPNTKTLFSATFRATPNSDKHRMITHTFDSELGEYDSDNLSKSNGFAPSLDLFFKRDFSAKNSLELQVVGTLSASDYRRDNHYVFDSESATDYVMNVDSRRRSLISEICYIHQFSDKTSLLAGYQNTVSHSTNTYLSSDYKPILTENNNYVYARLGQQIGKVYLALSTGAKLFWIENDLNKRHFVRNLSSVTASWKINSHWNIQGSFRYSPNIPSLTSLTDYAQQASPYLVNNGNPDLKVSERFAYRMAFSYQTGKFSASYTATAVNINKNVISDVIYLGNNLFLEREVNARKSKSFQNDLNLGVSDIAGFGAKMYLCYSNYQVAGDAWKHNLNSFSGAISLWWNKGPYTISYWRKLPGKYLNGHNVSKDENGDALGFDYKPNKHWTVGVMWMYMFETKGTKYPSWNYSAVNPSSNDRYIKNNGNMVVFSASYSADFGSIFRSTRRSLNNADNGSSLLQM